MIARSIRHNLANLLRFSGRDRPRLFWPWVIALLGIAIVAMMAVMLPEMFGMFIKIRRFAAEHPDQATVIRTATSESISIKGFHPELMPDFRGMIIGIGAVSLGYVILVAASVTRRLHDRNWRGWWALVPLVLLINGLADMTMLMSHIASAANGEPPFGLFVALFANNLLYLAALAALIVQLVQDGTKGGNRFGPASTD